MAGEFVRIALTWPDEVPDEVRRLTSLLDDGFFRIHLRKPTWNEERTRRLLDSIPVAYYNRLVLHDHHALAEEYGLGGVHVNSRNPVVPLNGKYSVSCHSIEELDCWNHADYIFLSPIFDSISKKGYHSAFSADSIKEGIKGRRIVALGGVTPARFPLLKDWGFYGAAMLGYLWK